LSASSSAKRHKSSHTSDTDASSELDNGSVVVGAKDSSSSSSIINLAAVYGTGDEWPFEGLCEHLALDLFDPNWEVRHGAALAFRDLLTVHANGAGKLVGLTRQENEQRHQSWLLDLSIRLTSLLALDRFSDFVGDSVVVPVRETAGMALGIVVKEMKSDFAIDVVEKGLLTLVKKGTHGTAQHSWAIRHAGLVGIKFWMAVRRDLVPKVINPDGVMDHVIQG